MNETKTQAKVGRKNKALRREIYTGGKNTFKDRNHKRQSRGRNIMVKVRIKVRDKSMHNEKNKEGNERIRKDKNIKKGRFK